MNKSKNIRERKEKMKFNKLTSRALALAIGTSMVFSQPAFAQTTQVTEVVADATVSGNIMEEQADENQDTEVAVPEQVTEDAAPAQEDAQATETVETEDLLEEEVEENEEVAQEEENEELDQAGAADEEVLIITSARDLKEFATKVNGGATYKGKVIKLGNDIQFDRVTPNNFTPIANRVARFEGTFDGCGYTISDINVTDTVNNNYQIGLFGIVGENGVVKNVTVKDSQFSGNAPMGGIVGINYGFVDNCHNRNVQLESKDNAGGIVGVNNKGAIIVNCSSTGSVSMQKVVGFVGGVAGENYGDINNSCNMGIVECDGIDSYAGGIAGGVIVNGGMINNCYNVGLVKNVTDSVNSGGIAGKPGDTAIVANSYCSTESSESNFAAAPAVEMNNDDFEANNMQTQDFVNQLNRNIGDNIDWLQWEIRPEESTYPLPVKRVNVSDCTVTIAAQQVEYNGTFQTPQVTVSYEGKNLVPNKDYTLTYQNNKNVGTATVVIKGLGRFIDSTTANFTITSKNIAKTNIAVNSAGCVYTGYAITPVVVVKDGDVTLQPNKDYVLGYYNHVNVGTATVVVEGKGNYTGSVNKSFTISKADQKIVVSSYYQIAYGTAPTQLYINRTSGDGQITYSSSDSKIVSIDSTGKMTFKKIGSAVIAVNVAETANCKAQTLYVTVNIIPKRATVSSVKVKGKTLTVKWKKDKSASGYIVQYSTSKNFKKGVKTVTISKNKTVSKKIKGLKANKKYYVRVCSYKKVSGQKVQGAYSVVKSVKTKK